MCSISREMKRMSCSIRQLHQLQPLVCMIWMNTKTRKKTSTNCSAIIQVFHIMHKTMNFGVVIRRVILTITINNTRKVSQKMFKTMNFGAVIQQVIHITQISRNKSGLIRQRPTPTLWTREQAVTQAVVISVTIMKKAKNHIDLRRMMTRLQQALSQVAFS